MKLEKKINIDYILIHTFYQMMAGIVFGFGVFILVDRGYTSGQVGLCMSLSSVITIMVAPVLSNFLDKSDKVSAFEVVIFISTTVACLYGINYFLGEKCLLLSIIYIIGHGVYTIQEPLINSMSAKFISNGLNIGFTTARAFGSLSYGLVCAVFGILTNIYSYKVAVFGGAIFCLLSTIAGIRIRSNYHKYDNHDLESVNKEENISFKEFLKHNKLFLVLCIFITGLFIGYTATDNFMLLITENVGGTNSDMGLILAFKAIIEAIAFFLFPKFLKKIKLDTLLLISAIAFIIKQLCIYLAPSVFFLYIAECFEMISFSFVFPGMIEYINVNLSKKEIYRGNAVLSQTIGIGSLVSSIVAGSIAVKYDVTTMVYCALILTIISAIGFVVTMAYKNKKTKNIQ